MRALSASATEPCARSWTHRHCRVCVTVAVPVNSRDEDPDTIASRFTVPSSGQVTPELTSQRHRHRACGNPEIPRGHGLARAHNATRGNTERRMHDWIERSANVRPQGARRSVEFRRPREDARHPGVDAGEESFDQRRPEPRQAQVGLTQLEGAGADGHAKAPGDASIVPSRCSRS